MERLTTDTLELSDPYLRRFEARIVAHRSVGDLHGVVLDRSAFYPGGGGQPADGGTISGIPVVDVREVRGERLHLLAELPRALSVDCELDWARRFDHMQQHHGAHLLARAFSAVVQADTESFSISSDRCVFDVAAPLERVEPALPGVEAMANEAVWRNLEVEPRQDGEVHARSGEMLRVVIVTGYDATACGGTHPRRTGEVGGIALLGARRWGNRTRVEFVCGGRVLAAFSRHRAVLEETARALRSAPADIVGKVAQVLETTRVAKEQTTRLHAALARLEAERLVGAAPGGLIVSALDRGLRTSEHLHAVARAVAARGRVALLGAALEDGTAGLCFARPRQGAASMRRALAVAIGVVGGRGGGSDEFAHGAGPDPSRLAHALALGVVALHGDPAPGLRTGHAPGAQCPTCSEAAEVARVRWAVGGPSFTTRDG